MKSLESHPVTVLAPMAGVTDYPFRQMVRSCGGASWMCSEMVASQSAVRNVRKTLRRVCFQEEGVVVQLAGNDPEILAEAACMAQDRGAMAIDLNMGCPAKKIAVSSYAGSALMRNEALVGRIFRAVKSAVNLPVSVKIRKGWDSQTQNALNIAHMAQQEGLSHVTIHGRTRCQMFTGSADWPFITHIQQNTKIPIIGNGDITRLEHLDPWIGKVHGFMIGRASYGRPWFLGQVAHYLKTGEKLPDPPLLQRYCMAKAHVEELLLYYGSVQGVFLARKHLTWYSKGMPHCAPFRLALYGLTDAKDIWPLLRDFYYHAIDRQDVAEPQQQIPPCI